MTDLERTYPRFHSHPCRRKPTRLHAVYQHSLDVVSVLWVSFVVWCLIVIFLGVG